MADGETTQRRTANDGRWILTMDDGRWTMEDHNFKVLVPLNLLWDVVRLFLAQASERDYLERDRLGATGDLWGPSITTHSLSSGSSFDLPGEFAAANV